MIVLLFACKNLENSIETRWLYRRRAVVQLKALYKGKENQVCWKVFRLFLATLTATLLSDLYNRGKIQIFRYANIIAHHSGINNRHHVVWTNRSGRIYIDRVKDGLLTSFFLSTKNYSQGVKLYSISSVKCHQIEVDCRGPKSPWFALVDPAVSMVFI